MVRISGVGAHDAIDALCLGRIVPDRAMRLRALRDPKTNETIDHALVVAFPDSASPTGELYGELHVHGGVAVPAAILWILGAMPGLRVAEPGEFVRRSLDNNRIDLTQIEGIADLVEAQTEAQRRQAIRLLEGGLSNRIGRWREGLTQAQALLEASIEFSDEDLPETLVTQAIAEIGGLAGEIREALRGGMAGAIVREGLEIAIIGSPNVGKSSIINMLAEREVALTSPHPGTTRDVVELRLVINGHLVIFLDTAGIREATDPVERAGVELARRRAAAADLRLLVRAPDCPCEPEARDGDILVWNKSDISPGPGVNVSALHRAGLDALLAAVNTRLVAMTAEADVIVRARHREMLERALTHLVGACERAEDLELCAEEVRLACHALDRLIGKIDCEEVLGSIFSRLCIGK